MVARGGNARGKATIETLKLDSEDLNKARKKAQQRGWIDYLEAMKKYDKLEVFLEETRRGLLSGRPEAYIDIKWDERKSAWSRR